MTIKKYLFLSMLLCIVVGCAPTQKQITNMGQNIEKQLNLPMTYEDVNEDISNVDLFHQMDIKENYQQVVKEDIESSTQKIEYYDGEELVYVHYIGYGEDSFDYYTKSKSGKDMIVTYVDQDQQRYSVSIETDEYSVSSSDLKNQAMNSYIMTLYQKHDHSFDEYITYCYENNILYLSDARYFDEEGCLHKYNGYFNGDEIEEDDYILYEKCDNIKESQELLDIIFHAYYDHIELLIGNHQLSYDLDHQWYITGNFAVVFDNVDQAKQYANDMNLLSLLDEDNACIMLENMTLKISEDFMCGNADFYEFASQEVNDYYYMTIEYHQDGLYRLYNEHILSYY